MMTNEEKLERLRMQSAVLLEPVDSLTPDEMERSVRREAEERRRRGDPAKVHGRAIETPAPAPPVPAQTAVTPVGADWNDWLQAAIDADRADHNQSIGTAMGMSLRKLRDKMREELKAAVEPLQAEIGVLRAQVQSQMIDGMQNLQTQLEKSLERMDQSCERLDRCSVAMADIPRDRSLLVN